MLRSLNLRGNVSFVCDTGADSTLLMPIDGTKMGVPYGSLQDEQSGLTPSGEVRFFSEDAAVIFTQPGKKVFLYNIRIDIAAPNDQTEEVPSLLGRDIIQHWKSIVQPSKRILSGAVLSADYESVIPHRERKK